MKSRSLYTVHELQCLMADLIHQKYQEKVYSLSACSNDYDEDQMQEYKLQLGLQQSGVTCPSKQHKIEPLKHPHGNRRI